MWKEVINLAKSKTASYVLTLQQMNLIECENKKSISNNTNSNNTKLYHRKIKWHDYFDKQSFEIIKNVQEISCHAYNHIIDKKTKKDII
jgi:hypothetical protein